MTILELIVHWAAVFIGIGILYSMIGLGVVPVVILALLFQTLD